MKQEEPKKNEEPKRTLTVSWEDPQSLAEAGRGLSGLAFLQKILSGKLPRPPIAALMNFELVEVREGYVAFGGSPAEFHYNPIGGVHGGLAATLLDSAMGCAVHSMLATGVGYITLEIKVNFVSAMTSESGHVRCEGKVIHLGGRTATAEGRIVDNDGRLYAHGTTTCLSMRS